MIMVGLVKNTYLVVFFFLFLKTNLVSFGAIWEKKSQKVGFFVLSRFFFFFAGK